MRGDGGFLSLHLLDVVNTYVDGDHSQPYFYECVLRKWLDAVVLLLTGKVDDRESVCLRSSARPPVLLRSELDLPMQDRRDHSVLWELPAGLLEDGDRGDRGILRRAAIEALEETGYTLDPDDFSILPGSLFVSPGVIPERVRYVLAKVADPHRCVRPVGDGSIAEQGAGIWWIPLDEALSKCDRGEILDMKTELGIRRLATGCASP